jgi:hypothetical protein
MNTDTDKRRLSPHNDKHYIMYVPIGMYIHTYNYNTYIGRVHTGKSETCKAKEKGKKQKKRSRERA